MSWSKWLFRGCLFSILFVFGAGCVFSGMGIITLIRGI